MSSRISRQFPVLSETIAYTLLKTEVGNPLQEDVERWRRRITSTPSRVVNAVRFGYDASGVPNAWSDTPSDFYAVTVAVGRAGMERQHDWPPLVNAGVIDEICKLVIYMQRPPILDAKERPPEEVASVYIRPFIILYAITMGFPQPLTRCDSKVIASIKAHWSQMMARFWDDPQNTLSPNFTKERVVASSVMLDISMVDPSFLSVVEKKSDKTAQVFARHMVYSSNAGVDAWPSSAMLTNICQPFSSKLFSYRKANPLPPHVFHHIMLGVGSPHNFISAFTFHLDHLWGFDAEMLLRLLQALLSAALGRTHPMHAEFIRTIRESGTFWSSTISLMRRSATDDQPDTLDKLNGPSLLQNLMPLLTWFILDVKGHPSEEECFSLVKVLTDYDIFGALEDLVTHIEQPPDVLIKHLCGIFIGILEFIKQDPSLIPLIRRTLPRQKMSIVLKEWARASVKDKFYYGCTNRFSDINHLCILNNECFRRGCYQKCRARCGKCQDVMYCGQECQKLDWNEHKTTCKRTFEQKSNKHPLPGKSN